MFQDLSQAIVRQCDDRVFINASDGVNQAAKTASFEFLPRGWMAVTPVRTGLAEHELAFTADQSRMSDLETLNIGDGIIRTGAASKVTPRSLARGFVSAKRVAATA